MSPGLPGEAPPRLRLEAPAKLNLGLRLVGRRPDGYHLLESLFAPVGLADEVDLVLRSPSPGARRIELEIVAPPDETGAVPPGLAAVAADASNLAWRAAEAFLDTTGEKAALSIRLTKRIPAGGGLGGGSTDAGAVLRGLARLRPGAIEPTALSELALALGADVPFFLEPQLAWVTGIGESITPVTGFPALDVVLASSGNSLATADVYRVADELRAALTPPPAGSTMRAVSSLGGVFPGPDVGVPGDPSNGHPPQSSPEIGSDRETDVAGPAGLRDRLSALLVNDLQPAAERLCPAVGELIANLEARGALAAAMSGSGATVFGVFAGAEEARGVARELRADGEAVWSCATRLRVTAGIEERETEG